MGFMRMGEAGERESTQHGVVNDITVPKLRLQHIILYEEIRILIVMALLPIIGTLIGDWVFPFVMVGITLSMFYRHIQEASNWQQLRRMAVKIVLTCFVVFVIGFFLKNGISIRLKQGQDALLQWPPRIGYFLNRVIFLTLPFFVPPLIEIPLLNNFFRITLLDPTWPSPRKARDIEGLQSPDIYDDMEEPIERIEYPITVTGRTNGHGQPTQQKRRSLFAPQANSKGMAEFGLAILNGQATFSEKGSRPNSKNPKKGATHYGFTQTEYAVLRLTAEKLDLLKGRGNKKELNEKGIAAIQGIVKRVFGKDSIPLPHPD